MAMQFYDPAVPATRAIHASVIDRGRYLWSPPEAIKTNGRGLSVEAPYATLTWTYTTLDYTGYNWWRTTLLQGAASRLFTTGTILKDDLGVERSIFSCIVRRPTYEYANGGRWHNVKIEIDTIRLA